MEHLHLQTSDKVFLYSRKYLGEGKYFQRGIAKGIQNGDTFISFTSPMTVLVCSSVITKDSNGRFRNPEDAKDSLFEGEFIDKDYQPNSKYSPLTTF